MSCTIIIFNYESLPFLRATIRQIRKYEHPEIKQTIIIADQSSEKTHIEVLNEFGSLDIQVVKIDTHGSGYSVDYIIRNIDIKTEYVCTLDVDAFPIHINWLYASIQILNDGFTWVGVHAEVEGAYAKYGKFFCMAQYFRVGRTKDYKDLSLNGGFTKYTHRPAGYEVLNNQWRSGWSDDGVTAHWWEDQHRNNSKFTYAVTDAIGRLGMEPLYGRITDGLIFHLGYSFTGLGIKDYMGEAYCNWLDKINRNFTDCIIQELLVKCKPLKNPIPREKWNGITKEIEDISKDLNDKINNLIA